MMDDSDQSIALVGTDLLEQLSIANIAPGTAIWVGDTRFAVVGIAQSTDRDPTASRTVYLPYAVAQGLTTSEPTLVIRTEPGYPAAVAEAIPFLLDPANPAAVRVETAADLRSLARGVKSDLSAFITTIGLVIMLLATLSAGATMTLSVLSRTQEIALRRAVGTSRSAISAMFMAQGIALGLFGGIVGAAAGALAIVWVSAANQWAAVVSAPTIGIGVVAGLTAGAAASMVPALRAAKVEPSLAIRS